MKTLTLKNKQQQQPHSRCHLHVQDDVILNYLNFYFCVYWRTWIAVSSLFQS